MILTRETAEKLLAECGSPDCLTCEYATALLAAWDEMEVLLNRALDEGQILAALRDCEVERDAVNGILLRSMDQVKTLHRAEAAEAKLAERDAEIARLRETLEWCATTTSRLDIRAAIGGAPTPVGLFAALTDEQQRQALAFRGNPDFGPVETAEAKVARLVEAIERIKSRAMWVRGDQSYREFPKYILNAVRDALADIKGAKT